MKKRNKISVFIVMIIFIVIIFGIMVTACTITHPTVWMNIIKGDTAGVEQKAENTSPARGDNYLDMY